MIERRPLFYCKLLHSCVDNTTNTYYIFSLGRVLDCSCFWGYISYFWCIHKHWMLLCIIVLYEISFLSSFFPCTACTGENCHHLSCPYSHVIVSLGLL